MSAPDRHELEVALCALLAWPTMTTARLRVLTRALGFTGALDALAHDASVVHEVLGGLPGAAAALLAKEVDVGLLRERAAQRWTAAAASGMSTWLPGDPWWQQCFGEHSQQPAALFVRGSMAVLDRPRVALVGTRAATPPGRAMAERLGRELGNVGVSVVSGLAFGIDAHAHAGTLASAEPAPVGVVGSGLDVVYPARHRDLWERVASTGLLVSEYPPGTRPSTHTFPARNRIIAALSQVVVVVESTEQGGSLLTAQEAHRWRRPLMVVPGNPMHPSSAGSNGLLRERLGERPVLVCLETADVLAVLMLDRAVDPSSFDPRPDPGPLGREVLEALGWEAASTSLVVARTGRSPAEVAAALDRLEDTGWITCRSGQWSQRAAIGGR